MFKAKVKKQNQVTNQGEFKTLAEAQEWIKSCEAVEAFGAPETTETILVFEAIPEIRDEEGNVIQEAVEAVYETKVIPAEYEIEIENITQQVAAEKTKKEEKRLAKEKRKADRKAIDFDKITNVKQVVVILKSIVEELESRDEN